MRTTLKRGLGRGAAPNGNGKAALPPGAPSPVTLYRQPERSSRSRAGARRHGRDVARHRLSRRRNRDGRWRVPLLPRVRRCGGREDARGQAGGPPARRRPSRAAGGRARDRLRPPQGGRSEHVGPLRHAHARPGRPVHGLDLAPLVPARHARRDPLSGTHAVLRQDQRRVLVLRPAGVAPDRSSAHRRPDQLPHHRQLPRLPADRRPPRRGLDRRRPAVLQRPRRSVRLRDDQPAPGLPAAQRAPDARLRALPAHRLRPLPRRAPAAVREGVQGPDPGELRADCAAEGRQRDHEQRRGRAGWRRRRRRTHGALVRALRLRAAERPRLPDADRGSRGRSPTSRPTPRTSRGRSRRSRTRTSSRPRRRRRSRSARR